MYKKKKSSNLGKTRDHQAQVSFSSTSSLEAEMDQDSEANNSKANYSNKEMIEAQVDSLRLLNQVNIEMDNNYNHLMTLINHPVRIKILSYPRIRAPYDEPQKFTRLACMLSLRSLLF